MYNIVIVSAIHITLISYGYVICNGRKLQQSYDTPRYFMYKHTCVETTTDMLCERLLDFSRVFVTCLSNLHFSDERATQSLADYRIAKRYAASSRFGRSCHIREKRSSSHIQRAFRFVPTGGCINARWRCSSSRESHT